MMTEAVKTLSLWLVVKPLSHVEAGHQLIYQPIEGEPRYYQVAAWMRLFPEVFGPNPMPIDTGDRYTRDRWRTVNGWVARMGVRIHPRQPTAIARHIVDIDRRVGQ